MVHISSVFFVTLTVLFVCVGSTSHCVLRTVVADRPGLHHVSSYTNQALGLPNVLKVTPEQNAVYAGTSSLDRLTIFQRDIDTGRLSTPATIYDHNVYSPFFKIQEIVAIAFSPKTYLQDEAIVFVGGKASPITWVWRNTTTGLLSRSGISFFGGELATTLAVPDFYVNDPPLTSGDSTQLLSTSERLGDDDYRTSCRLSLYFEPIEVSPGIHICNPTVMASVLSGPVAIVVSRDGRFVYYLAEVSSKILHFTRTPRTNSALTFQRMYNHSEVIGGKTILMNQPTHMAMSPDDRHLYVSGGASNSLNVFRVSPSDGRLTLAEVYEQGGSLDMLSPRGVVVTPDGAYVAVVAEGSNALLLFLRDAATGLLRHVDSANASSVGITNVDGVYSIDAVGEGNETFLYTGAIDTIATYRITPHPVVAADAESTLPLPLIAAGGAGALLLLGAILYMHSRGNEKGKRRHRGSLNYDDSSSEFSDASSDFSDASSGSGYSGSSDFSDASSGSGYSGSSVSSDGSSGYSEHSSVEMESYTSSSASSY